MTSAKNSSRFLGAAFLMQAIASAAGGLFLLQPLIVQGNTIDTMTNIANNVTQMRASIVLEMITATGIVMLGVLMYTLLNKQNRNIAIVAMGLYIVEAALLAASRIAAFALIPISLESVATGHADYLQGLGSLFFELQSFGYDLHMLPFALGASMFYYLFFRSGYIPRTLALWGLIAASMALVGTLFVLFGYEVPLVVFIPNLPFELAIGVWLLVKGINDSSETEVRLAHA